MANYVRQGLESQYLCSCATLSEDLAARTSSFACCHRLKSIDIVRTYTSLMDACMDFPNITCIVVGDSGVGKTVLLIFYSTNTWNPKHIPHLFDDHTANVMVDGKPIHLNLRDTNGDPNDIESRAMRYAMVQPNVALLMFDIMRPDTFYHIQSFWVPEIKTYCPNIPYILVGNKSEARNTFSHERSFSESNAISINAEESNTLICGYIHKYATDAMPICLIDVFYSFYFETTPITHQQGTKMMKDIGATQYIETSCWTQDGVKDVFDQAIRSVFLHQSVGKTHRRCMLM
eukprot:284575_1